MSWRARATRAVLRTGAAGGVLLGIGGAIHPTPISTTAACVGLLLLLVAASSGFHALHTGVALAFVVELADAENPSIVLLALSLISFAVYLASLGASKTDLSTQASSAFTGLALAALAYVAAEVAPQAPIAQDIILGLAAATIVVALWRSLPTITAPHQRPAKRLGGASGGGGGLHRHAR